MCGMCGIYFSMLLWVGMRGDDGPYASLQPHCCVGGDNDPSIFSAICSPTGAGRDGYGKYLIILISMGKAA